MYANRAESCDRQASIGTWCPYTKKTMCENLEIQAWLSRTIVIHENCLRKISIS